MATAGPGLLKKKSTALFGLTSIPSSGSLASSRDMSATSTTPFKMAVSVLSTILIATHMNKRHREFKGGW